jgi:hypothetical protein
VWVRVLRVVLCAIEWMCIREVEGVHMLRDIRAREREKEREKEKNTETHLVYGTRDGRDGRVSLHYCIVSYLNDMRVRESSRERREREMNLLRSFHKYTHSHIHTHIFTCNQTHTLLTHNQPANASNLLGAVTNGKPVSAAIS